MKKNISIIIILIIATTAGIFFLSHKRTPQLCKSARQMEAAGDMQAALSLYAHAAVTLSPSKKIPDINDSKFLAPEILKKDIMKYFSWICIPPETVPDDLPLAIAGIERNMQHLSNAIVSSQPKVTLFTQDSYSNAWNTTFFAPAVKIDPSHAPLTSGNFLRNLSLVIIECGNGFSYEICLMNRKTMHSTTCLLLAENSVRLYALPGEHLLLVRSIVNFPSGEIWESPYSPLPLTIPEQASEIRLKLRSHVKK